MESNKVKPRFLGGNGVVDSVPYDFRQNPTKEKMKLIRLRYHLAAEGCRESQVSLARSLLEEATSTANERLENCELAVRWLLLAAEEGHMEALTLLKECYHNGIGLTARNREQVETCLSSGEDDKLAHNIGNSIFRMLTYDTQDKVPLNYFVRKINSLVNTDTPVDLISEDCCDHNITIIDIVDCVLLCLQNRSPKINLVSGMQAVSKSTSKVWQLVLFLSMLVTNFSQNVREQLCRLETVLGALLVILIIPSWGSLEYRNFLCGCSILILLFATTKILHERRECTNMLMWQKTIMHFKRDATFSKSRKQLFTELFLYLVFVSTLVVFLGTFNHLISNIISSVSAVFACVIIFSLNEHTRFSNFTKASLSVHLLLAVITYYGFTFFDLRYLPVYTNWETQIHGVSFTLNLLVPCIASLSFPYYHLSSRYNVISYFLTVAWIRILILLLVSCDFLKVFVFLTSALLAAKKYSLSLNVVIFLVLNTVLLQGSLISLVLFFAFIVSKCFTGYLLNHFGAKILLLLLLPLPWLAPYGDQNGYILEWNQFASFCYKTSSQQFGNSAQMQDICLKFHNTAITFEGTVAKVEQYTSENLVHKAISVLPLNCQLRCIFGEPYPKCNSELCALMRQIDRCPCHIEKWQLRTYNIFVIIKTTFRIIGEVEVIAENSCKDFVHKLQEGDNIFVNGLLKDKLGTNRPKVVLQSAKCLNCVENISCNPSSKSEWFWDPKEFVIAGLQFVLGPFVVIHKSI